MGMAERGAAEAGGIAPEEALAGAARLAEQARRLGPFLRAAHAAAPAVRELFERVGARPDDIRSVADLARLPITRKDALIDLQRERPPFGGFLGVPIEQLAAIYTSPGPLYDPAGARPDYWRWAPALRAAGFRPGDIALNTVAYHLTPLGMMFEAGLRAVGCPVIPAGPGNTDTQLRLMRDLRVAGYTGTPSFLGILLDRARELGGEPARDYTLRAAFVAAEMLPESLRRRLEAGWGCRVRQGYGTADVGCLAYECELGQGMHVPIEAIVEIVDPATGQPVEHGAPGEVVCTVLEPTYPLVRFGTGDLSAFAVEPCGCGRGSPRLTRIMGRIGDAVKVRAMFVHPRQLAEAAAGQPEILRHQLVVTRQGNRDEMTWLVVAQGAVGPGLAEALAERLRAATGLRGTVELVPPERVPEGAKPIDDRRTWD